VQHRLGRDDFDNARELMGGSPATHTWGVCERYELKRLADAPEGDRLPYVLVPKYNTFDPSHRDKWRTYAPLEDTPDLFLRFARLHERGDQIEAMVDWVHSYGVLGQHGETPRFWGRPQFARDFKEAVGQAAGILALYEAVLNGDEGKARSAILEEYPFVGIYWRVYNFVPNKPPYMDREWNAEQISEAVEEIYGGDYLWYALETAARDVENMVSSYCIPSLSVEEGSRNPSGVTAKWNFKNLLGAMYLQMYWLMAAGGNVTRCKYCGRIIYLTSPLPGARKTRQDKKFCDDACRQRHHYHTKTKPGRQGNISSP
jgi:hypothetical protein